jgi:cobalamin 5'-phosphate synthase/cobalamin synthase
MTGTALRAPLAAIAFLTRVPVGERVALDARDVARGAPLFPLVGGAVGGSAGLLADGLAGPLPALLAGALAVGLAALLTGAMHLDAVADTADALGGSTRERALEIMRDHAVGAFGAVALVLVCLVDAAALGALGADGDAALVGLAAGAGGRAAILPVALVLPYARAGDGQGRVLDGMGVGGLALGIGLAVVLALPAGAAGLAGLAVAAGLTAALGLYWRRWLGGVTGDTLGATAKLAETAILVTALAVL